MPGKPDESLVYQVAARSSEPVMPPLPNDVQAKPLTPKQLGVVRQWILEGASSGTVMSKAIAWQPINPRLKAVYSLAHDAHSGTIAASRANAIALYDVHRKREIGRLVDSTDGGSDTAHRDIVQAMAMSSDGRTLASGDIGS